MISVLPGSREHGGCRFPLTGLARSRGHCGEVLQPFVLPVFTMPPLLSHTLPSSQPKGPPCPHPPRGHRSTKILVQVWGGTKDLGRRVSTASLRESSGQEPGDKGKGVESPVGAGISSSTRFYFLLLPPGRRTTLWLFALGMWTRNWLACCNQEGAEGQDQQPAGTNEPPRELPSVCKHIPHSVASEGGAFSPRTLTLLRLDASQVSIAPGM